MRVLRASPVSALLWCLISLVGIVGALVALRWVVELVANSGRGLDASDESYYLLAVEYPHSSRSAVTGFDSYLAPIWWLCGSSISRYRVVGVVIVLSAVATTARLCNRGFSSVLGWPAPTGTTVCAVTLASLSLTHYVLWITTPGYNLVVLVVAVLVAGLTTSIAMAPVSAPPGAAAPHLRWLLEAALGFSLSVGMVVKAPAFLIILVLSGAALVITRGPAAVARHWYRLAAGFAVGLVAFVGLSGGSPWEVASQMARGIRSNRLLGGHTAEALWELTAMRRVYGPWFLGYLVGALALALLWRVIRRDRTRLALTALGSVVTAVMFGSALPRGGNAAFGDPAGWWWIRLAAMMVLWSTANVRGLSRRLALGPLVALMAVGAAAGSGNGVIREVALTVGVLGVGLLVHGLVVASSRVDVGGPGRWPAPLALAVLPIALFFLVGALASMGALNGALDTPYHLVDTLHSENERVDLGAFGTIQVHPETARYVRELQVIAKQVPADARDCVVDLAGGTPLSAIAIGARPAEVPWILGGYPGSNEFADYVLRGTSCLSGGYVLIEAPTGSLAIARPAWLDTSGAVLLGQVQYDGYFKELQSIWLVPPVAKPPG